MNAAVSDLQHGFRRLALFVAYGNAMQRDEGDSFHFLRDRMFSVTSETIDAGTYEKMRVGIVRRAKQFVDIAFAVSNVDASLRIAQQSRRLLDVVEPAHAFFFFDRNPSGVDLLFERIGSLEFLPGPKLDGGDSQRQSFSGDDQTGMHENAAGRMEVGLTVPIFASSNQLNIAYQFRLFSSKGKLCRVVENKNQSISAAETISCRLKMSGENVFLAY